MVMLRYMHLDERELRDNTSIRRLVSDSVGRHHCQEPRKQTPRAADRAMTPNNNETPSHRIDGSAMPRF